MLNHGTSLGWEEEDKGGKSGVTIVTILLYCYYNRTTIKYFLKNGSSTSKQQWFVGLLVFSLFNPLNSVFRKLLYD